MSSYNLVCFYFIKPIEFPAKKLRGKVFMDKGMASSADINATLTHVRFIEVLSKPLVTMTASGNQMMEGN